MEDGGGLCLGHAGFPRDEWILAGVAAGRPVLDRGAFRGVAGAFYDILRYLVYDTRHPIPLGRYVILYDMIHFTIYDTRHWISVCHGVMLYTGR